MTNRSLADLPFSGVQVRNVAGITLVNATLTTLSFDTVDHDTDNYFNSLAPVQIVTPVAGYYEIEGSIGLTATTLGSRLARITVSGNIVGSADAAPAASLNGGKVRVRVPQHFIDAGQAIQLLGYQNSGSNLNSFSGTYPDH